MGVYQSVSDLFKNTFDAISGGPAAYDAALRTRTYVMQKPVVDSAAADVTSIYEGVADETSDAIYLPLAVTIYQVKLMPLVALTADGSNYATVTAAYNDGAGGSATAIATLATDVAGGSWVVGTAKAMAMTAPVAVPAGSWLTFSIAKTGTGVAVSPFRMTLVGKLT